METNERAKKELVVNNMEKIIGKPGLFKHMGADWNQVETITMGQTVKKVGNKTKQRHKVRNINIFLTLCIYTFCLYIRIK